MKKISRVHDTSKLNMIQLCVPLKIYHMSIVNMFKKYINNDWKKNEKSKKKVLPK